MSEYLKGLLISSVLTALLISVAVVFLSTINPAKKMYSSTSALKFNLGEEGSNTESVA